MDGSIAAVTNPRGTPGNRLPRHLDTRDDTPWTRAVHLGDIQKWGAAAALRSEMNVRARLVRLDGDTNGLI
ncbi:hypothetical protein PPGU19_037180 [Paraburkholderia sp. PGU19]|nr:hypothetical protein PPGU19_037180 [Paraburkholderia sp. PGU19]